MSIASYWQAFCGVKPATYGQKARQAGPGGLGPLGPGGQWHTVYENKRQPDAGGTRCYAYETLGLCATSPIGPAVAVRHRISYPLQTPVYFMQGVTTVGIPIAAGTIYGQPLVDGNYQTVQSPDDISSSPFGNEWNVPDGGDGSRYGGNDAFLYNQAFPDRIRGI